MATCCSRNPFCNQVNRYVVLMDNNVLAHSQS